VYFEQNTEKADGNIYDLYIDADNDITTGLLTGEIPMARMKFYWKEPI
jgi:hypothetical protein